jgi:hypothetical protein
VNPVTILAIKQWLITKNKSKYQEKFTAVRTLVGRKKA